MLTKTLYIQFIDSNDVQGDELSPQRTQVVVRDLTQEVERFIQGYQASLNFRELKIRFSDEIKMREFRIEKGDRVLSYYRKLAGHGEGRRLEDSLSPEILKEYSPIVDDSWFKDEDLCFTSPILGEFDEKEMAIVLYRAAISMYAQAGKYDKMALINAVLAHEFFHAYHYLDCRRHRQNWNYRAKNASIVKESLAAAFEYSILRANGEAKACRDFAAFWELVDVNAYPYSGALGLLEEKTMPINKYHVIYDIYVDSFFKWRLAAEDVVGLYRVEKMG